MILFALLEVKSWFKQLPSDTCKGLKWFEIHDSPPFMHSGYHPWCNSNTRPHTCTRTRTVMQLSSVPAICCRSKGQSHWRNLVCWISRITEHLIWILPLYVCIQKGPSGAMKFAIVAQCGCFQTLWHDLWVSVLCVTAQCAHCLSHNAPFSPGPLSLSPSFLRSPSLSETAMPPILSLWLIIIIIVGLQTNFLVVGPNSCDVISVIFCSNSCIHLPFPSSPALSLSFCLSELLNTKDREATTGPQCMLVVKETRRQCWVFKLPQRGVWS